MTIANALPMKDFESKTLNRRFETIYFGTPAGDAAAAPMLDPHGSAAAPGADSNHGAPPSVRAPLAGAIPKAEGPEGRTIAEVYAQRALLEGQPVAVRGQVTKSLQGIMGKNWLHLQDGSGTVEAGDFDLTVTTAATASVGDVVVVRGTVAAEKDIGSGYFYTVLVEDAAVEGASAATDGAGRVGTR
jgi:hypothetical protein